MTAVRKLTAAERRVLQAAADGDLVRSGGSGRLLYQSYMEKGRKNVTRLVARISDRQPSLLILNAAEEGRIDRRWGLTDAGRQALDNG